MTGREAEITEKVSAVFNTMALPDLKVVIDLYNLAYDCGWEARDKLASDA